MTLKGLYPKVARKVLRESLSVKKGDAITVETWNNGLDFSRVLVAEARSMGCTAITVLEDEAAYIEGLKRSPKDRVGSMGRNEYGLLAATDAYVFIPGPLLAAIQTKIDPSLMSESTRYNESWYDAAEKAKLRGARLTFGYIGEEMAGAMGRTVRQVVEKQLNAALVDFGRISDSASKVSSALVDASAASISAGGARLDLVPKGDTTVEDGVVSEDDIKTGDGMTYVPPGLVSKRIDPNSSSGTLKISKTLTRLGAVEGAELTFKEGRLVKWTSPKDMRILSELVKAVPEERRRLNLINVGINPRMDYMFGQDRMVAGSVTASGFGFTAVLRTASLKAGRTQIVDKGKLL